MEKWNDSIRGQLNNLASFPWKGEWRLGEWIEQCHVRPEVAAAAALPLVDNELGDVRFAVAEQAWYLWDGTNWVGANALPFGPAGGDLSGTYPNPLVVGLQGRSVPNLPPSQGQVLQWTGTEWVPGTIPSGGSGGGGLTYFLNQNTNADPPTTGLTAPTVKELGLIADGVQTTATKLNVTTVGYDQIAGFVTDLNVPSATSIPAGLWDFNVWASTTAAGATKCSLRTQLYKYDGTTATLVSTAEPVLLFNGSTLTQYTITLVVPPTALLVTDRLYVVLEATAVGAGVNITTYFGDGTPSHVLSTMPAVQGTGVIHVINGVVQSPATPVILTADVSGVLPIANGGTALSTIPTNGQLLIGNGVGYTLSTLTPGSGISVTNGAGSITVANTGVLTVGATAPIASSGGQNPVISLNASGVVAGSYGTASSVPTLGITVEGLVSSAVNTPIAIDASQITSGTLSIVRGGTGLSSAGGVADRAFYTADGATFTVGLLPNAALANSSLTINAGTGLSGGGLVALGGSTTLNIANTGVVAASYGSASAVATFAVNAQGQLTTAATVPINISASQVTSGVFPSTVAVQNTYQTVTSQVSGASTPLAYGEVVYFTTSGGSAANPAVDRARANVSSTAATVMGLVAQSSIPNSGTGYIITQGVLVGNPLGSPPYLNTNAFQQGDILYIDTTTAGALTNVKPSYPNIAIPVGIVIVRNQYTGAIYVNPTVGLDATTNVKTVSGSSKITLSAPGTTTISSTLFNGPPAVEYLALDFSGAGNVTLSTGPIQALTSSDYGRNLIIHNVSTKTVTFNAGGTTFLSGGVNLVLQPNSLVSFMWSYVGGGVGHWLQMTPAITVT